MSEHWNEDSDYNAGHYYRDGCVSADFDSEEQRLLQTIDARLTRIEDMITRADKAISTIADQVMPTIDQLTKSPMLKMLGVKTK